MPEPIPRPRRLERLCAPSLSRSVLRRMPSLGMGDSELAKQACTLNTGRAMADDGAARRTTGSAFCSARTLHIATGTVMEIERRV